MSYPKVIIKKSKFNKNVLYMSDEIPEEYCSNNGTKYCDYYKFLNEKVSSILPVKKTTIYNKEKYVTPSDLVNTDIITCEHIKTAMDKCIIVHYENYLNIDLTYTRKVNATVDYYDGKPIKNVKIAETYIQTIILNILKSNQIKVNEEVRITDINRFQPRCDLILNTILVELKSTKSMIYKRQNSHPTMDNEEFWLRVIFQAWFYNGRFNYNDKGQSLNEYKKIIVSDGTHIMLVEVMLEEIGDKFIFRINVLLDHTDDYEIEQKVNYNSDYEVYLQLSKISQYITWFNFHNSAISSKDVVSDLRFYAETLSDDDIVKILLKNKGLYKSYSTAVSANFTKNDIESQFEELRKKAVLMHIIKRELLNESKISDELKKFKEVCIKKYTSLDIHNLKSEMEKEINQQRENAKCIREEIQKIRKDQLIK